MIEAYIGRLLVFVLVQHSFYKVTVGKMTDAVRKCTVVAAWAEIIVLRRVRR
jgi:hypothetical protein